MNTKNIISDISTKVGLPFLIAGASLAFAIQDTHAQVQTPQTKQQKEIVISLQDSTELSYNRVSEMLEANQITQAMNILAMKPDLAASLTQEQVQHIGWEKIIQLGPDFYASIPATSLLQKDEFKYTTELLPVRKNEPHNLQGLKEAVREKAETARLTAETAREKAETARMEEIKSDLQTWQEYKNDFSAEDINEFKKEISSKINKLETKERKELAKKMFATAGLDLSVEQK